MACANARANAVASQVATAVSEGYALGRVRDQGPYDLILANILAEPLNAMARDLTRHLAPGGLAVLSGLLTTQEQMVLARHRAQGFCLVRRIRLGDWSTLVLRRPG